MARSAALAIFAESPAVGPRAGIEGDGWPPSKESGMLAHGPDDPRAPAAAGRWLVGQLQFLEFAAAEAHLRFVGTLYIYV